MELLGTADIERCMDVMDVSPAIVQDDVSKEDDVGGLPERTG